MKCQTVLPVSLLLLWTLTASVSCEMDNDPEISVKTAFDTIVLSCGKGNKIVKSRDHEIVESGKLTYEDKNTGEYMCRIPDDNKDPDKFTYGAKIYVKIRTCDDCIELDLSSIMGLGVGSLVATIVMGVAVYLIASQIQNGPITSHKKSSDRQHLVPNEVSNRAPNDHYQPLKHKTGQRDMYDVLNNRK